MIAPKDRSPLYIGMDLAGGEDSTVYARFVDGALQFVKPEAVFLEREGA